MQDSNCYCKLVFPRHLILNILRIRHCIKLLLCIHTSGIHYKYEFTGLYQTSSRGSPKFPNQDFSKSVQGFRSYDYRQIYIYYSVKISIKKIYNNIKTQIKISFQQKKSSFFSNIFVSKELDIK